MRPFLSVPEPDFYARLGGEDSALLRQLAQVGNGVLRQGVALYEDVRECLRRRARATRRLQAKAGEPFVERQLPDVVDQLAESKSQLERSLRARSVALSGPGE